MSQTYSVTHYTSPRQAKAVALVEDGKVTRTDTPHRWFVQSQTGQGGYVVDMRRCVCECPDYTANHMVCKHILAVTAYRRLDAERQQRLTYVAQVNARIEENKAAF